MSHESCVNTTAELKAILERITFKNTVLDFKWAFEYQYINGLKQGWLLWVTFERPDTITGVVGRGRGREELIWRGTSLSGVVKTAWLLVELMIRHELMEGFCFDGKRIFNPHNSVLDLARLQEVHDGTT